jgi:hypothetical protein
VKRYLPTLTLAAVLAGGSQVLAADKREVAFGALETMSVEAAQAKAAAWLRGIGKSDAATMQRFQAVWKQEDRTVLDMVAETLALGDPAAAQLLADARNTDAPAPTKVPDLLKDTKNSLFYRANLALAYARALSNRRVHEESLGVLKNFRPEQVVDPAAYLFHRSVAEHALLNKAEATVTITRLLDDGIGSPERYKTVSALMLLDMQAWKDKDLGAIARKMENIERRLDLARGGPQTQKLQKEVIMRLDELIKELENKAKAKFGSGGGGGGECPNGDSCPDGGNQKVGSGGGANPKAPMPDSQIALNGGSGRVDIAKLNKLAESWGKLPRAEQAKVASEVEDLISGLSPVHRAAFERYWQEIHDQGMPGNKK